MLTLGILASSVVADAGSYDLLETTILGSDTASVSFTGLGSYTDYKHLQIRMTARSDASDSGDLVSMQFNSDTGSNYAWHFLRAINNAVASGAGSSQTSARVSTMAANNSTANSFGGGVIDILDFSSASKNTTVRCLSGITSEPIVSLFSGLYNSTTAITSAELFPLTGSNFRTGSRFSLYGIKAA